MKWTRKNIYQITIERDGATVTVFFAANNVSEIFDVYRDSDRKVVSITSVGAVNVI